jgi:cytochrome c-type biogenesis protein CcsB
MNMKIKMPLLLSLVFAVLELGSTNSRAAITPASASDDFASRLDLAPLRIVAVQHNQTLKTLDTFARQAMKGITGSSSIDGHEPLFTLLDMSFRPENYLNRNIIRISSVPLRQEFLLMGSIDAAEKDRILKQGTVSLVFMEREDVIELLQAVQARSPLKTRAINELWGARSTLRDFCRIENHSIPAAIIAPATTAPEDHIWHRLTEMLGASPVFTAMMTADGRVPPAAPEHYEDRAALMDRIVASRQGLDEAWTKENADDVNLNVKNLGELLPQINPAVYPSEIKRSVEVVYNRWMMLTIPGAGFYFIAFVLFLLSSHAGVGALRLWGLRFMLVALAIHTLGIGVRWWLVGDVFPPIKNEFESVMFSAWFGAVVGLILELRRSQGIFGAAASFVGTLALVAIYTAPFVTHTEIGGEISPVQGVLMSYWLYIHVTMVTAAYSLIAMGFVLSSWWLVRYYAAYGTFRRVPANLLSSDGVPTLTARANVRGASIESGASSGGGSGSAAIASMPGGAGALGFGRTLAMAFFFPVAQPAAKAQSRKAASTATQVEGQTFLATLDKCNLVVLQLAFWVLGVGVVLGAIWADQSWGRPWGWDPKETFALITWIVYLITVHVRVVTEHKAWWTAVLGCIGFFVMLFNWVGVNFFLVGLHSYA